MVAPQHHAAGRRHLHAVTELRAGRGQWGSARGEHPGHRRVGEAAEHHDHPDAGQGGELPLEIGQAAVALDGRGPVRRRRTAHRRGDVGVAQLQAVSDGGRGRLVGEAGPEHGREQPVAGTITREDPAGAVGAVGRGREARDQDPGPRVAEPGYRAAPVRVRAERRPLLPRHLLAPLDQTRARPALDDLGAERPERGSGVTWHRPMLRVGFAAVRVLLLVNPAASSVTTRARVAVEGILAAAFPIDVVETTRRGHATELARDAVTAGYDVVAVLAGDGTLNEAADGLAGSHTALAPLPGGSTNVFARTLGIAYDPADATVCLVDSLGRGSSLRVGLGAATGPDSAPRRFLFHLGLGFDAAIIRRMEARSYLKRHFAHPAFAVATVATWLRHYDRGLKIRLSVRTEGGADVVATGPYAVISNSDPYTYVGRRRMTIAPAAALSDRSR